MIVTRKAFNDSRCCLSDKRVLWCFEEYLLNSTEEFQKFRAQLNQNSGTLTSKTLSSSLTI